MPNIQFPATAEGLPNYSNATHASLFLEFTPDLRKRMEQTVEHLIWLLDTYDGDPDLEDDGTAEEMEDAEPDVDDEPNGDDEPSLAALEIATQENRSQTAWAAGNCSYDRELDDCDNEWDFRNATAEL